MLGPVPHTLFAWLLASLMAAGNPLAWWHCGSCVAETDGQVEWTAACQSGGGCCQQRTNPFRSTVDPDLARQASLSVPNDEADRDQHDPRSCAVCQKAVLGQAATAEWPTSSFTSFDCLDALGLASQAIPTSLPQSCQPRGPPSVA